MTFVSNTSPIRYLLEIDAGHVLPALFRRLLVPPSVLAELKLPHFPKRVRDWAASPPEWVDVRAPADPLPTSERLHPGEADAIALAIEVRADRIIMDDAEGVRVAREHGIAVVRTLTVLAVAGERGLVRFADALRRLIDETRFRITPELVARFVAQDASLREHIRRESRTLPRDPSDPPAGP